MPTDSLVYDQPDSPEKRLATRQEYRQARDFAASTRAAGRDAATVARWDERAASFRDTYMGMNCQTLDHTHPRYQQLMTELEGTD